MGKYIYEGSAKKDDPIYSSGCWIGGKSWRNSTESSPEHTDGTENENNLKKRSDADRKRACRKKDK